MAEDIEDSVGGRSPYDELLVTRSLRVVKSWWTPVSCCSRGNCECRGRGNGAVGAVGDLSSRLAISEVPGSGGGSAR